MTLDKIIAISGKPGLYKILSAGKKNIIVESLMDRKRFPVLSSNNISTLDTIAMYTEIEEIPLPDIFYTVFKKEKGKATISHKAKPQELEDFFLEVLPDYDTERVYISNIKKLVQWYNILINAEFDFNTLQPEKKKDTPKDE